MRCGLACAKTRPGRLVAAKATTPAASNWRRLTPVAANGWSQQLQIADSRRLVDCDIYLPPVIQLKWAEIFYMFPLTTLLGQEGGWHSRNRSIKASVMGR